MPRPAILDVHEWTNEVLTVPGGIFAKPQTRERASGTQRGKKTLLSLTPVRGRRAAMAVEPYRGATRRCKTLTPLAALLTAWRPRCGERAARDAPGRGVWLGRRAC